MPDYRRDYVPGGTYFFTVVTHLRRPLFTAVESRTMLRQAIQSVRKERPFKIIASVLLPDHYHCIWVLPHRDSNYSVRWRQIKEAFTHSFLERGGAEGSLSTSRARKNERGIWQRRFWEHTCRDQDDLNRCIGYIHWNPVKHGLVARVRNYPWSSSHDYVKRGIYTPDWGGVNPCPDFDEPEWE